MTGTTGQPKPVRLSHFNVVNNANLLGRVARYHQQREIICLNSDLIYGFGRTMGVLTATIFGSTVVMPDDRMDNVSTTHACLVALIVDNNLNVNDEFFAPLSKTDTSASGLDKVVVETFEKAGIPYKKNMIGLAPDGANNRIGVDYMVWTLF
ncbi:hypothetical protein IscW_ISCW016529 [Ixodes scapularis]|uniref:AMP-dependent synthetase/ligase domain-containing protein n=1 Tax=Ixodes scapularis TaxID=6945 RepID=B7P5V7_IXOSC|nr:hypothetical protein IscW_ISCW016529 [Ixodes scapularis]|eukprot:XP_002408025.1 hypothetical protein IscW_ISCW016529 [Ixodes scapularis]